MFTKINLKFKSAPKETVGFQMYSDDKEKLEEIAKNLGLSVSTLLRSLANDVIDGNIILEAK